MFLYLVMSWVHKVYSRIIEFVSVVLEHDGLHVHVHAHPCSTHQSVATVHHNQ